MAFGIPTHKETVTDGALALSPASTDNVFAVFGTCGAGTAGTIYAFSKPGDVQTTLVSGPGVQAAAHHLSVAGGQLFVVPVNASVAGTNGTVTVVGSSPAVTLSGTPNDDYQFIIKIMLGGTVGTATFQVSKDGGDTYSATITTAATYLVPGTGVTINFTAGTYVVNDTESWTSVAPFYTTTDLNNAINLAVTDPRDWSVGHIVGFVGGASDSTKATNAAAVFSAVSATAATLFTAHRFVRFVLEMPDVADTSSGDTALQAQFGTLADPRIACVYGFCELASPLDANIYKRPAAWPCVSRAKAIGVGEDPAWVGRGPLPGAVRSIYHNEDARNGPDALRFTTLRTMIGRTGFYITNFRLFASTTSDFQLLQHGRLIDKGCRIARNRMLDLLSQKIRAYGNPAPAGKSPGTIVEQDAAAIEGVVGADLDAQMVQKSDCVSISVSVSRTANILSSGIMPYSVRLLPFAYPKEIDLDIGFTPITAVLNS